jgi:hypothetical protein
MSTITLTMELSTNPDGSIDQDAWETAAVAAVAKRVAELETSTAQIAEVVSSLFDQFRGQHLKMPALASAACNSLNTPPEYFGLRSEQVLSYVRANSQGKTLADGTVERPSSIFLITKGKNGGASRRADQPVEA